MRGRADILLLFASPHLGSPAAEQLRKPDILTRHRSTAQLRVVGIETYRVAYRGAYSRVERSRHVPPTHPRNDYQPLRWPSSFTQRVYSQLANVFIYFEVCGSTE